MTVGSWRSFETGLATRLGHTYIESNLTRCLTYAQLHCEINALMEEHLKRYSRLHFLEAHPEVYVCPCGEMVLRSFRAEHEKLRYHDQNLRALREAQDKERERSIEAVRYVRVKGTPRNVLGKGTRCHHNLVEYDSILKCSKCGKIYRSLNGGSVKTISGGQFEQGGSKSSRRRH